MPSGCPQVVKLLGHQCCAACIRDNRECWIEENSLEGCSQCTLAHEPCTFTRIVSKTAPRSKYSWSELTASGEHESSWEQFDPLLPAQPSKPSSNYTNTKSVFRNEDHIIRLGGLTDSKQLWENNNLANPEPPHVFQCLGENEVELKQPNTIESPPWIRAKQPNTIEPHPWIQSPGKNEAEIKQPKRTGPLSKEGRLKASMTRSVGACWRCKMLKRQAQSSLSRTLLRKLLTCNSAEPKIPVTLVGKALKR